MSASHPHRTPPLWVAMLAAILVGVLTALQARVNGQLGIRVEDGFIAAWISFASGLVVCFALTLALPVGRAGLQRLGSGLRARDIPWWMVLGGAAGALTVATQGLTVAIIGVSLFTVGLVAGQSVAGLVLDRVGYGPAGVVQLTGGRLAGGALALCAVGISLSGDAFATTAPWMLVLPFLAGLGIAWQQATNGRLRHKVGTPLVATLVNFLGGTIILSFTAIATLVMHGAPLSLPTEPWLYLGGTIGVVYIFLSAAVVSRTGVLLLGLASVVGQLITSALLDAVFPAAVHVHPVRTALMMSLAFASVVVATLPWQLLLRGRRNGG